jgi:hypothetical protein
MQERNREIGEAEALQTDTRLLQANPGEMFQLPLTAPADTDGAIVTIKGDAVVSSPNAQLQNISNLKGVKLFVVRQMERGQQLVLNIKSGLGGMIEVGVGWVRKAGAAVWKKAPCQGCKAAANFLLSAALAQIGAPIVATLNLPIAPPGGAIASWLTTTPMLQLTPLEKEAIETVGSMIDTSQFGELVRGLSLWKVIQEGLKVFDHFTQTMDSFYTWCCGKVGLCP